jgi:hypothetical protein
MAFVKVKGKTKIEWLPVTASTALAKGTLVEFTSGLLAAADDNEAAADIRGVLAKTIAATDADYATSARLVPVIVPVERHVVWEADTADTYVLASHCGVECGIVDSANVDLDDTTNDAFLVISGSGTKVRGYLKINGAY